MTEIEEKFRLNQFIDDKMEQGYCYASEWHQFEEDYLAVYGHKPKLFGEDIRIVEDVERQAIMQFRNKKGHLADCSEEKQGRTKTYFVNVTDKNGDQLWSKCYPSLKGVKIALGRLHEGWEPVS